MPKMELLGNLILSNLMVTVMTALQRDLKIDGFSCWTDSMVSLSWIKATEKVFKVFVQNRLTKIRANCEPSKWEFCCSKDNPADIITRFYMGNLKECKSWLNGPEWIMLGDPPPKLIDTIVDDGNKAKVKSGEIKEAQVMYLGIKEIQ